MHTLLVLRRERESSGRSNHSIVRPTDRRTRDAVQLISNCPDADADTDAARSPPPSPSRHSFSVHPTDRRRSSLVFFLALARSFLACSFDLLLRRPHGAIGTPAVDELFFPPQTRFTSPLLGAPGTERNRSLGSTRPDRLARGQAKGERPSGSPAVTFA